MWERGERWLVQPPRDVRYGRLELYSTGTPWEVGGLKDSGRGEGGVIYLSRVKMVYHQRGS